MTDTMRETREEQANGGAKATLHDAASTAQGKAAQIAHQGGEKLRTEIDSRTGEVCRQARSVADALRQSAEQTRTQGNGSAAGIVELGARRADQVADYLERTNGDALLRDAQQIARQRPWLMAGAGVAAGMAVGRIIRASAARRQEGQPGAYGSSGDDRGRETMAAYGSGDLSGSAAEYGRATSAGFGTEGAVGGAGIGGTGAVPGASGSGSGAGGSELGGDWRQGREAGPGSGEDLR